MKRITVFTGHYGSGKSTLSANCAAWLAEKGENVTVVDMDTVNPYFRTADLKDIFSEKGVNLAAPVYAGTSLDLPVLSYDIAALYPRGSLIIDMGGDDAGTYPIGRYRDFLTEHSSETDIFYVMNFRRYLTREGEGMEETLREIQAACGMPVTGLVNNTNLGRETTVEIIREGIARAEEISRKTGIPLVMTAYPEDIDITGLSGELFPVRLYIKSPFE